MLELAALIAPAAVWAHAPGEPVTPAGASRAANPPAAGGALETAPPFHMHSDGESPLLTGEEVHYHGVIQAWMEPGDRATPDAVQRLPASAWHATNSSEIHPLRPGKTLWLRFLVPASTDAAHWYVEIPFANLDRASLYTPDGAGGWTAQHSGDLVPVGEWPVRHRVPLLRLSQQAGQPTLHLLRVQHVNGTALPLLFYSETHLMRKERNLSLMLGTYFGLMLLAALIALGNGFFTRDLAFSLFAVTMFVTALTQASFTGVAGTLLWPDDPWLNDMAAYVLPALAVASVVSFVWAVTSLGGRSRVLGAGMLALAALGVVAAGSVLVVPVDWRVKVVGGYALIGLAACMAILLWIWRTAHDRYAPWLLAGMGVAAAAATLHVLRAFEWLPTTFSTRNLMLAGVGTMCVFSLMTMLVRSRDRGMTALRMRGLHRIDPATGLAVPEVVMERLPRMTQRALRLGQPIALMWIELTNGRALRRALGRRADRDVPVHLASRLLGVVRDIDTVARMGDHQFALLIEGPITADNVEALATRVVAACTRPLGPRDNGPMPTVRLAWAHIPRDGNQPSLLLDQLAMLLSTAPPDDPRAIFRLH